MKKLSQKHERYQHGKYYIDIFEEKTTYEAYLRHKDYGVSDLMFGEPKTQTSYEEFLDLVKRNLPDYIETYKYNYEYTFQ